MKKSRVIPVISLALCLIALISALGVSAGSAREPSQSAAPSPSPSPNTEPPAELDGLTYAASYTDLYAALNDAVSAGYGGARLFGTVMEDGEIAMGEADTAAMPAATAQEAESSAASSDYSATNVQVSEVDEGDIVKTDGEYIYILRDDRLLIAAANGAETKVLSSTALFRESEDGNYEYAEGLYIYGDYAAVITSYNHWATPYYNGAWKYEDTNITKLYIYDVSDQSAPVLLHELGQDGYSLTSRLTGSTLYLLSTYYVYDIDEGDENTFVPALYRDGESELISSDCIAIWPAVSSTSYTVISAYNVETGELTANQTVLGGGGIVYMNQNSLYLTISSYNTTESEPYTEGSYTVRDYTGEYVTEILRFDISGGLKAAATGSVPGYLDSQFSMDEYNGHLRLVTTVPGSSWSTYTDETRGWTNYNWEDDSTTNALYILDSNLETVGSVEGLAENEYIYSARFDGDIGYFVTFRQTDPLFAVDLSDPANPQVLSALKIPGFSEYLHVFSEGRLFGLGMDADEETGRTNGMKMTMFDTSDPADVTEKHTLLLSSGYSAALYNHKAILISAEKDIIAFPTDSGYDVYGYSDEKGFYERAHIAVDNWGYNARGLYIGDMVYVITDTAINVFDMSNFKGVAHITF